MPYWRSAVHALHQASALLVLYYAEWQHKKNTNHRVVKKIN